MKLVFTVPGVPVAQARPRATTINGHVRLYDPKNCKKFKSNVLLFATEAAKLQGWIYQDERALLLRVDFYLPVYKSWSKKKRADALAGLIYPTSKPDLDNLVKGIKDALNQKIYRDDSQIIACSAYKKYDLEPRVEIELEAAI